MRKIHVTIAIDAPASTNDVELMLHDVRIALESSPHFVAHHSGALVGLVANATVDGVDGDVHRHAIRVPTL